MVRKKGLNNNSELRANIDGYQKSLSERDEIIQQLAEQVGRQKGSAEEYQNILTEKDKIISEKNEALQQLTFKIYNRNVTTLE